MNYKKIGKIVAVFVLIFIISLIAVPYLFKDKLKELVVTSVNNNLNARFAFEDVDLSLLSSFPQASLKLKNLSLINNAPFENDTLVFVKNLDLEMPISALFKGESETIDITAISIDEAYINIISNKEGIANYDIFKSSENKDTDTINNSGFNFAVKKYEIKNSNIKYEDETSNMMLILNEFNHSGSGDLSAEQSKLDTKSSTLISFKYGETNYFENSELILEALFGIDLKTNTYSFLKNEANISGLPLTFDGNLVLGENGQDINISFKTPSSSFKNFLAVMPKEYSKNLDNVKTEGDFKVEGIIKGFNNDERIPNIDINIASNNASFKYPDLPKEVRDIVINATVKNETGLLKNTAVNINAFNFRIDQDVFKSNGTVKNITINPLISANLNGVINLANISKAYPIKQEEALEGILKMDVSTAFDMDAIEKSKYERIKSSGNLTLNNFNYTSKEFSNPVKISAAAVNFTPEVITLKQFNATTGKTDINATGTINDLIGFVISGKELKGNFIITSNTFSVNDFMAEAAVDTTQVTTKKSALKIPAFLNCTISADAKTVLYDNLKLQNVKGVLVIKDEKVALQNVTSSVFGGSLAFAGNVSTKEATPTFKMDVKMDAVDISDSFNGLDLLTALAPISNVIKGKLNTTLQFSGNLNEEFTPNLNSLSGNAFAQILTQNIKPENAPLLNALTSQLQFIDLDKLDLKDIKTQFDFEGGKVNVKPFQLKYKDIDIAISGSHNFDKTMGYKATFMVPGKYLGSEVTGLMAKMSDQDASKIKVPITANITGNFSNPTITTDYKSMVSNLVTQLVESKLKSTGQNALSGLLSGVIKGTDSTKTGVPKVLDSTNTTITKPKEAVNNAIKEGLKGLLGGKKKKKDTIN
ncbi:AsmA family protein [Lutibacter sp. B1]|uniref:AsmA family protein n=1 Tax=Lutibacter sp. B1 TaxID=2725996 RepID=UPI0014577051|nr:AsmA family protein [Lutibacter sp. B1]NLP58651.1 AsmA family protein [Lutibacter sp. B1]